MKILNFEDREAWLESRKGKITSTRLGDVVVKRGTGRKKAFYELIAEQVALPPDGENPMDRGNRLQDEAIEKFKEQIGKEVETGLILWMRDDNEDIAVSPDGFIGETEAVEVKCLNSASHIEALLTDEIPGEYEFQVLQYFIVNNKLETLYFCFYDDRLSVKNFFYKTIKREDVQDDVITYLEYERKLLEDVKEIVTKLTF